MLDLMDMLPNASDYLTFPSADSSDDEMVYDNEDLLWLNQSAMRRRVIELAKEIELEELQQMAKLRRAEEDRLRKSRQRYEDLDFEDTPYLQFMRSSGHSSSTSEDSFRFGSPDSHARSNSGSLREDRKRRSRLCRHFLKGHCKRGASCDFLHDSSIFCPDQQKVFLGGLPAHVTSESLCQKLSEVGFSVINKPKVLRGFTPQVCLASVEEAKQLMDLGKILIDGCLCDVRPYEDKKPPDSIKKSIFLGGLPTGLTVKEIKESLQRLGVTVCNFPIIKTGFSPQVVLATPEEAQRLVKMRRVLIGGKAVEVRPYVNFRKRY